MQNESSQACLDAAHGILIDSFHKALHARRQTPQKEKRELGICCHRLCDSRVGEKQAPRRLGRYGSCGVGVTREKRHFSERSSGFARMDDHLTPCADADDAHSPLEYECNSF